MSNNISPKIMTRWEQAATTYSHNWKPAVPISMPHPKSAELVVWYPFMSQARPINKQEYYEKWLDDQLEERGWDEGFFFYHKSNDTIYFFGRKNLI